MYKISLSSLFAVLILMLVGGQTASAYSLDRVSGKDRYQTSVAVSQKGWRSGAKTVILVNGKDLSEAAVAAPLAKHLDAPVLMTNPNALTAATRKEIQRLNPKTIILLGGEKNLPDKVIDKKIKAKVKRIGGKDRYETAALVAKELPASTKALVVNGNSLPDILASAPYAAKNSMPILLTKPTSLPAVTKQAVKGKKSTVIVGGSKAVSDKVKKQLPKPTRISGSNRYDTSAQIAKLLGNKKKSYIVSGVSMVDALPASALAAKNGGNLLFVEKSYVSTPVKVVIDTKNLTSFTVIGGIGVIDTKVGAELKQPIEHLLVNKKVAVGKDYKAAKLVEPKVKFAFSYNDPKRLMDSRAVPNFEALMKAAWKDNVKLYAQSGYRSYDRQAELYNYYKRTYGEKYASRISAKPGTSEHQTGLAMDVTSPSVGYDLVEKFANTKEGKWVAKNAHKYGFIIRYPKGKENETGYAYEPWHLRYVGKDAAKEIYSKNITFEKYVK
ncbi:cell wall-binding repeat-containing protein [Rossellomorea marisflavi]|uniref:cell wall-binding repeat-containing protein n=1 Tax=Rossellomorea marisflavi TaxID=189381 RepID=UPI00345A83A0